MRRLLLPLVTLGILPSAGCLSPEASRFPRLVPDDLQTERAETRVHDPFPETDLGPGAYQGLRPPDFIQPRVESRRLKEKAGAAFQREQLGRPTTGPFGAGEYPGAVR